MCESHPRNWMKLGLNYSFLVSVGVGLPKSAKFSVRMNAPNNSAENGWHFKFRKVGGRLQCFGCSDSRAKSGRRQDPSGSCLWTCNGFRA